MCTVVSWVSWFAICRLSVEIVSVRQSEVPLQTRWICYVKTFWISLQNYSFCTKKCRKCRRHPTSHRIWQSSSLNSERMWVNCSDLMTSSMKCWCKHAREIWNTSTADWLLPTSLQNQVQVCFLILGTDFHSIRHLKARWAYDKTLLRLHLTREKAGGWTGHRPVYDVGKRFQQTMHDTIIIQTGTVWTQGGSCRRTFPARIHIRHPKVRESMNMTHNMHRSPWSLFVQPGAHEIVRDADTQRLVELQARECGLGWKICGLTLKLLAEKFTCSIEVWFRKSHQPSLSFIVELQV